MWEILSLPEKFKANKILSPSVFLSKANLTDAEINEVSPIITGIEIKYDVIFSDKSEIIFIEVTIKYQKDKWTCKNIARIVAKSIPYDCIIYIHDDFFGILSAFIRRASENDIGRSVIEKQSAIPQFQINDIPFIVRECLTDIGSVVLNENEVAASASLKCINIIEKCKDKLFLFAPLTEKIKEENDKIMFNLQLGLEDDNYELFDEECSYTKYGYFNDKIVISMSEEALCNSAYAFYVESEFFDSDDNEADNWLLLYAHECQSILDEIYNIEPNSKFYYRIGASFRRHNRYDADEYEDDPAIQLMKERISEGEFYA